MARRNKLQKFAQLLEYPNVVENYDYDNLQLIGRGGEEVDLKGRWAKDQFGNDHPLVLELACGRGEYTLALARRYPEKNFLGVDIKGARIWRGATDALAEDLGNVAFLRTRIEKIQYYFEPEEVEEIWITFPDPFLRKGKANRRLTSPPFLERYRKILKKGGLIHLKTDNDLLFEYTLEVLENEPDIRLLAQNSNIYAGELPHPDLDIQTYYEKKHLANGLTIKYIQFSFL